MKCPRLLCLCLGFIGFFGRITLPTAAPHVRHVCLNIKAVIMQDACPETWPHLFHISLLCPHLLLERLTLAPPPAFILVGLRP